MLLFDCEYSDCVQHGELPVLPNVGKPGKSERYSELFIKKGGNLRKDFLLASRFVVAVRLYVHSLSLIFG